MRNVHTAIKAHPTSRVIESMKCPFWQRSRLSRPMNQSGEGTSLASSETWGVNVGRAV